MYWILRLEAQNRMHGKLHAHVLICLMHAERAKQHITASLQNLIMPIYLVVKSFARLFCIEKKCLRGNRAECVYGYPVKELSEVTKYDNDKKVVIYRRISEKEDERVCSFVPSFKAVTRSHGSTNIATDSLTAAYLAKHIMKNIPAGNVSVGDLNMPQLLRPEKPAVEQRMRGYISMLSQSVQEIALLAMEIPIVWRSHKVELLTTKGPNAVARGWSNGHLWNGRPGGAKYLKYLDREAEGSATMTMEQYFSKHNFEGGKQVEPTIAYLMPPMIKNIDDIQVAAWYFILKKTPHNRTSDVVDVTQRKRTFSQSCVELGLVGSEEYRAIYESSVDHCCDIASGSGCAERIVLIEWAKELNQWHSLIGMKSKYSDRLIGEAWEIYSSQFERIETPVSSEGENNDGVDVDINRYLESEAIGGEMIIVEDDIGTILEDSASIEIDITNDGYFYDDPHKVIALPNDVQQVANHLKTEQWIVWLDIICDRVMVTNRDKEQMFRLVTGMAGTGKTRLILCLQETFEQMGIKFLTTAPSAIVAQRIGGRTVQSQHAMHLQAAP